jgi:hypothetical protein
VETPPAGDGPGLTPSRITRGGSWKAAAALCTVKSRQYSRPFYSADDLGFRVARSLQTDGDVSNSGDYPPTLVGSRWMWDSPWGLRILTFDTASHADFYEGWDDSHNDVDYVYNSGTGTGDITGPYAPGSFKLKNNNKTMHFPLYMNFGHSADYTLMEDEEGG